MIISQATTQLNTQITTVHAPRTLVLGGRTMPRANTRPVRKVWITTGARPKGNAGRRSQIRRARASPTGTTWATGGRATATAIVTAIAQVNTQVLTIPMELKMEQHPNMVHIMHRDLRKYRPLQ